MSEEVELLPVCDEPQSRTVQEVFVLKEYEEPRLTCRLCRKSKRLPEFPSDPTSHKVITTCLKCCEKIDGAAIGKLNRQAALSKTAAAALMQAATQAPGKADVLMEILSRTPPSATGKHAGRSGLAAWIDKWLEQFEIAPDRDKLRSLEKVLFKLAADTPVAQSMETLSDEELVRLAAGAQARLTQESDDLDDESDEE